MRPPSHSDLLAAARVLRARPGEMRGWVLSRIIDEAEGAHAWVRREGAAHPVWGDGTLAASAFRRGVPPQFDLGDGEYCRCIARVALAFANPRCNSDSVEPSDQA